MLSSPVWLFSYFPLSVSMRWARVGSSSLRENVTPQPCGHVSLGSRVCGLQISFIGSMHRSSWPALTLDSLSPTCGLWCMDPNDADAVCQSEPTASGLCLRRTIYTVLGPTGWDCRLQERAAEPETIFSKGFFLSSLQAFSLFHSVMPRGTNDLAFI